MGMILWAPSSWFAMLLTFQSFPMFIWKGLLEADSEIEIEVKTFFWLLPLKIYVELKWATISYTKQMFRWCGLNSMRAMKSWLWLWDSYHYVCWCQWTLTWYKMRILHQGKPVLFGISISKQNIDKTFLFISHMENAFTNIGINIWFWPLVLSNLT